MSAVIDELRLEPERYRALRSRALVRSVLLREADRQRVTLITGRGANILPVCGRRSG